MVMHTNICAHQSDSFKGIIQIYKEEQKGNSKHGKRK